MTGATSIFRRLARTRTTTIAISQTLARWLVDSAGFDPQSVHVKYNAVATPDIAVPAPSTSDTFVFVGKFAAYKGIDLLLDAWRRIEAPRHGCGSSATGRWRTRSEPPRAIPASPGPGSSRRSEVEREIAAARAVLVPSVWDEPFGRVAAEAFALGRPVVTTGTGALSEIVDACADGSRAPSLPRWHAPSTSGRCRRRRRRRPGDGRTCPPPGRFAPEPTTPAGPHLRAGAIAAGGRHSATPR